MTRYCPICDGELIFEITPPEYDVGLMGYGAILVGPVGDFACTCERTPEEIEALEYETAVQYAREGPAFLEP